MSYLWFLWSVLAASVTVTLCCKITEKTWLRAILLLAGTVLMMLFPCAEMNLYMYPYFVAGFFFAGAGEKLRRALGFCKYISLAAFPVMLLFYGREHYIYTTGIYSADYGIKGSVAIDLFRWAIGFAGSVFALTLMDIAFRFFADEERTPRLLGWMALLGESSLQIYCLSTSLLSSFLPLAAGLLADVAGRNVLLDSMPVYNFVITPLIALCYSVGLYLIVKIMKRMRIHRLIFGR